MTISNKPQHGERVVNQEHGHFVQPAQEFFDDLVSQLNKALAELAQRVSVGYGGIVADVSRNLPDISPGIYHELEADVGVLVDPVNVLQLPEDNAITFEAVGVWQVNMIVTALLTEVNFGRTIALRLIDKTDNVISSSTEFYLGRDVEGVSLDLTFLADIPSLAIVEGHKYTVEIGSDDDSFTNILVERYRFEAVHLDRPQG